MRWSTPGGYAFAANTLPSSSRRTAECSTSAAATGSSNHPEEARRVARQAVILKDHTRNGLLAGATLRLMDWVGNARHEVVLPYNYWPRHRWLEAFDELGLRIDTWIKRLQLYPAPGNWIFGRSLHFIAKLVVP